MQKHSSFHLKLHTTFKSTVNRKRAWSLSHANTCGNSAFPRFSSSSPSSFSSTQATMEVSITHTKQNTSLLYKNPSNAFPSSTTRVASAPAAPTPTFTTSPSLHSLRAFQSTTWKPTDYFSPRDETESPRTSYLSSVSVPSTPPILSHSRSSSRTRHTRSKSSTRSGILSDSNLHSKDVALPLHHQLKKRNGTSHPRPFSESQASKSDAEWMLRAGIALASSTREEKGQSWLSKRESSTSLVSMPYETETPRHHHRTKSSSSGKSRSGASTPALSRRTSRSRGGSRRGSPGGAGDDIYAAFVGSSI